MAAPRRAPIARCEVPLHRKSHVYAKGTYARGDRRFRRYRCQPRVGEVHTFSVLIDAGGGRAIWAPPPPCPGDHTAAHIIRFGTYGKTGQKRRQRYRCTPADGSAPHVFTPPLPREHVHPAGETCEICQERRGTHHGETAIARRHGWSTPIVAAALDKLSAGATYGEVSKWALEARGTALHVPRRRSPPPPRAQPGADPPAKKRRIPSRGARLARNAWHIAADWTEAFSPVIFGPIEAGLREHAMAERARLDAAVAAGVPLDRPQVLVIDDLPVYGRDEDGSGTSRRDAGFFLIVVAEILWHDPGPTDPAGIAVAEQKIRLIRAMPKANGPAWRLVFDELGYAPDFVVGDASTAIVSAVGTHFGKRTQFIPSLWHLARAVRFGLEKTPGAVAKTASGKRLGNDLWQHMGELGRGGPALANVEAWSDWWDRLEAILRTLELPGERVLARRRLYERQMTNVLPALIANPALPMSTGGLENLIERHVEPMLAKRRAQLANIERTNALMDLAVARIHGSFVRQSRVVELLRKDAKEHAGWTVSLRSIADPYPRTGRYSSLRDPTLLASIARERGIA